MWLWRAWVVEISLPSRRLSVDVQLKHKHKSLYPWRLLTWDLAHRGTTLLGAGGGGYWSQWSVSSSLPGPTLHFQDNSHCRVPVTKQPTENSKKQEANEHEEKSPSPDMLGDTLPVQKSFNLMDALDMTCSLQTTHRYSWKNAHTHKNKEEEMRETEKSYSRVWNRQYIQYITCPWNP